MKVLFGMWKIPEFCFKCEGLWKSYFDSNNLEIFLEFEVGLRFWSFDDCENPVLGF